LAELAAIPAQYEILVSFGFHDRQFTKHYNFPDSVSAKDRELTAYKDVVARLCESVEKFMREIAPDEITLLIAEDRDSIRQRLKSAHSMYRDTVLMQQIDPRLVYFPFSHIRDTIHFAKKNESAHLQVADVCTFVIKRRLMKCPHITPLFNAIKPQMLVLPPGERRD